MKRTADSISLNNAAGRLVKKIKTESHDELSLDDENELRQTIAKEWSFLDLTEEVFYSMLVILSDSLKYPDTLAVYGALMQISKQVARVMHTPIIWYSLLKAYFLQAKKLRMNSTTPNKQDETVDMMYRIQIDDYLNTVFDHFEHALLARSSNTKIRDRWRVWKLILEHFTRIDRYITSKEGMGLPAGISLEFFGVKSNEEVEHLTCTESPYSVVLRSKYVSVISGFIQDYVKDGNVNGVPRATFTIKNPGRDDRDDDDSISRFVNTNKMLADNIVDRVKLEDRLETDLSPYKAQLVAFPRKANRDAYLLLFQKTRKNDLIWVNRIDIISPLAKYQHPDEREGLSRRGVTFEFTPLVVKIDPIGDAGKRNAKKDYSIDSFCASRDYVIATISFDEAPPKAIVLVYKYNRTLETYQLVFRRNRMPPCSLVVNHGLRQDMFIFTFDLEAYRLPVKREHSIMKLVWDGENAELKVDSVSWKSSKTLEQMLVYNGDVLLFRQKARDSKYIIAYRFAMDAVFNEEKDRRISLTNDLNKSSTKTDEGAILNFTPSSQQEEDLIFRQIQRLFIDFPNWTRESIYWNRKYYFLRTHERLILVACYTLSYRPGSVDFACYSTSLLSEQRLSSHLLYIHPDDWDAIKHLVGRYRTTRPNPETVSLAYHNGSFSFPSDEKTLELVAFSWNEWSGRNGEVQLLSSTKASDFAGVNNFSWFI